MLPPWRTRTHVVAAAARALGKIGTPEAARLLGTAKAGAQVPTRATINEGLIVCAARLLATGRRDEAGKVYHDLSQPGENRTVRMAALCGVMPTADRPEVELVAESLASNDAMVRAAAVRDCPFSRPATFARWPAPAELPAQPGGRPDGHAASRRPVSLAAVALEFVRSKDEGVRLAAVQALGTVGDADALLVLWAWRRRKARSAMPQGRVCKPFAARTSIKASWPPCRTRRIPARAVQWIALLESRQARGGVPTF